MALDRRLTGWVLLALVAPWGYAHGEIYRCPDGAGRSTYTNVKQDTIGKNCTVVTREVSVVPAQAPVPARFLSPDASRSIDSRTESRRRILESELQNEQQLLSDSKQKLAEQQAVRNGDERNYARVLERLKPYQDAVDQHTKNIEQLQSELARIYR